jgi:hypothetical protein
MILMPVLKIGVGPRLDVLLQIFDVMIVIPVLRILVLLIPDVYILILVTDVKPVTNVKLITVIQLLAVLIMM